MTDLHTEFDWAIYANPTFAGLAVLIPLPPIDWAFETFFWRRMPLAIARHRNRDLEPAVVDLLRKRDFSCLNTCLTLPIILTYGLLKKISRKIIYVLTVKEATDKISHYWHQAFLIDYALLAGHLDTIESARLAHQATDQLLESITTSPLSKLAEEIVQGTGHILQTLLRVRRGQEDEMIQQKKMQMREIWPDLAAYFAALAALYDQIYRQLEIQDQSQQNDILPE